MADLAGFNRSDAFMMAKEHVARTKREAYNAKQELEAHMREHECS